MRTSWRGGTFGLVLTCAVVLIGLVAYRHFNQPPPSVAPSAPSELSATSAPSEQADRPPRAQEQVLPLATMHDGRSDEARVQDINPATATSEPVQLPSPQKDARLEETTAPVVVEPVPVVVEPAPVAVAPAPVTVSPFSLPS